MGITPIRERYVRVFLPVILAGHFVLNIVGIDWGLPYFWHTDEKIDQVLHMFSTKGLDPDYFINPDLQIYLMAGVVRVAYAVYPGAKMELRFNRIYPLTDRAHPDRPLQFLAMRLSRGLSASAAVVMVFVVFLIARRHFDDATALLAAAFTGFTMGIVNLAHFATPESVLFLLVMATLASCDLVATRGRAREYAIAGAAMGLALSTKYTVWLLWGPLLVAHLLRNPGRMACSREALARLGLLGAVAVAAFLVGTPYAIPHWRAFWDDAIVYNWFTGTPTGSLLDVRRSWMPYLSLLANGLGWPLFALSVAGLGAAAVHLWQRDDPPAARRAYAIHLAWIVPFFAFYGVSPHHALRFIMPIAPSLGLLAAAFCGSLIRGERRPVRIAGAVMAAGVCAFSLAYTIRADLMFLSDTRYAAAQWLDTHVTPGARVDYFGLDSYLPYFDPPKVAVCHVPFVDDVAGWRRESFWDAANGYLHDNDAVLVDTDFYYNRFLENPERFPDRARFYRRLLAQRDAEGYRVVASFADNGPAWFDPRPERISPEILIFAKPTTASMPLVASTRW